MRIYTLAEDGMEIYMEGKYRIIDRKTWKRNIHCKIFCNALEPQYCISLELDITRFLKIVKQNGYSFTLAFIYAVCRCANEIEEFRYRFLEDEVVLYDMIHTSFTYLDRGEELFKFVSAPMQSDMGSYVKTAIELAKNQKEYFAAPPANDAFIFLALPWIFYTHISHTISGNRESAAPMFDWGKFFERDKKVILPFSVQVHHSFVDGIHVGRLVERLQEFLDGNFECPIAKYADSQ